MKEKNRDTLKLLLEIDIGLKVEEKENVLHQQIELKLLQDNQTLFKKLKRKKKENFAALLEKSLVILNIEEKGIKSKKLCKEKRGLKLLGKRILRDQSIRKKGIGQRE